MTNRWRKVYPVALVFVAGGGCEPGVKPCQDGTLSFTTPSVFHLDVDPIGEPLRVSVTRRGDHETAVTEIDMVPGDEGWEASNPKCLFDCYITARVPQDCGTGVEVFDTLWEYPGLTPIRTDELTWYDEVDACLWDDLCGTILLDPFAF